MKFKKFLIIPLLIFFYLFFIVDALVNYNPTVFSPVSVQGGAGQPIGVGNSVSVIVMRPYLFGLVKLPVYTNYIGYIGDLHEGFFTFMMMLTVGFVIIELWNWRKGYNKKGFDKWREWR